MRLAAIDGFALDLDGTLWAGDRLLPGAAELIQALRSAGLRVVFLSNSSRQVAGQLAERLAGHGIPAVEADVISALDLLGTALLDRIGRARVLAIGAESLAAVLVASGHAVLGLDDWPEAQAVAVGNDPAFDFARLRAASRAVAAGAEFLAVNVDPRLPTGPDSFDPGCGALVSAIAVAAGREPTVLGKPHRALFDAAIARLGGDLRSIAMVGDSPEADIVGGHRAGLSTIWVRSGRRPDGGVPADLLVEDPAELLALWRRDLLGH